MILTVALGAGSVLIMVGKPVLLRLGLQKCAAARSSAFGFACKVTASTLFCLAGISAAAQQERLRFRAAGMLLAFCCALVGDILLAMGPLLHSEEYKTFLYLLGGGPFLLSQLCYTATFLSLARLRLWLLPVILMLPLLVGILWGAKALRMKAEGIAVLVYAGALSAMVMAAVNLALDGGMLGRLVLPAALLFAASDTALFLANLGAPKVKAWLERQFTVCVMLPYYLAQALFAATLMYL
ncbi:MAG: lysoplasmalogenase [Oscillospiraceae bacterium]|jgi:uncharacterized membrane protein YhhN|nr:lysoplasmalogenase [Oscillospiraceae bacterium]